MATNVTMPKLGLTMETGKIVEWKAAEGGEVKEGEILLIVETEKITKGIAAGSRDRKQSKTSNPSLRARV